MLISSIVFYIFVVELTIGLDFVKEVDKNWKKHIKSLDRDMTDEDIKGIFDYNIKNHDYKTRIQNEKTDSYWDYWKKKYGVLR